MYQRILSFLFFLLLSFPTCAQVVGTPYVVPIELVDCLPPNISITQGSQTYGSVGNPITLSVTDHAPNTENTYTWTIVSGVGTLSSNTGNQITVTSNQAGTLKIKVKAKSTSPSPCESITQQKTINVCFQDLFANTSLTVDQESYYSGGIGRYSSYKIYVYGLPSVQAYGSDYTINVNGTNYLRSSIWGGSRIYACILQPENSCLQSGRVTVTLPNGKKLSVVTSAPSTAPWRPHGSNSLRRQICKENNGADDTADNDYTCQSYSVN